MAGGQVRRDSPRGRGMEQSASCGGRSAGPRSSSSGAPRHAARGITRAPLGPARSVFSLYKRTPLFRIQSFSAARIAVKNSEPCLDWRDVWNTPHFEDGGKADIDSGPSARASGSPRPASPLAPATQTAMPRPSLRSMQRASFGASLYEKTASVPTRTGGPIGDALSCDASRPKTGSATCVMRA